MKENALNRRSYTQLYKKLLLAQAVNPKEINLTKRVERLENVLIGLVLYKHRCKYPYLTDLKAELIRQGILKERKIKN